MKSYKYEVQGTWFKSGIFSAKPRVKGVSSTPLRMVGVYEVLHARADVETARTHISVKGIADTLGIKWETANSALTELADLGAIEVVGWNGHHMGTAVAVWELKPLEPGSFTEWAAAREQRHRLGRTEDDGEQIPEEVERHEPEQGNGEQIPEKTPEDDGDELEPLEVVEVESAWDRTPIPAQRPSAGRVNTTPEPEEGGDGETAWDRLEGQTVEPYRPKVEEGDGDELEPLELDDEPPSLDDDELPDEPPSLDDDEDPRLSRIHEERERAMSRWQ